MAHGVVRIEIEIAVCVCWLYVDIHFKLRTPPYGDVVKKRADKPRGMLIEHEKNSYITSRGRVIYEFFECSSNIRSGLSAYKS